MPNGRACCVEESILMKEVLVRIARQSKLGEDDDSGVRLACALRESDRMCRVVSRIAEPDGWDTDRDSNEPVSINRIERGTVHILPILSLGLSSSRTADRANDGDPCGASSAYAVSASTTTEDKKV